MGKARGDNSAMRISRSPALLTPLLVALSTLIFAAAASAAFPGRNGPIAFVKTGDDIYLMRGDGTHERLVYHDRRNSLHDPAFSPNGKRIVFVRQSSLGATRLAVVRRDGTHLRRLTHKPLQAADPGFSPTGRRIVFAAASPRHGYEIMVMRSDGTHRRALTHVGPNASIMDLTPEFRPSGNRIVFERDTANTALAGIYVMRADGTHLRRLTDGGGDPDFSADGKRIAFERGQTDYPFYCQIVVMRSDGSHQEPITDDAACNTLPAFSPNGKKIAFQRDPVTAPYRSMIYAMRADGTHQRRLTGHRRTSEQLNWGVRP